MKIPTEITAGDSISWDDLPSVDNLGNSVDSSTWTLKYDFRQSGATNLTITGTANDSGWRIALTKTHTAGWAEGNVHWQAYAESGSDRVTLGRGVVVIKKNITTATNSDEFRSQDEQDLDAVQAAIRAMISGGAVQEYTIGGRSLRKIALADLLILESRLKARVASAKQADSVANGLGNPNSLFVRFS